MNSNMFSDQSACISCNQKSSYLPLSQTTHYSCDQPCLCRFDEGRSTKDQMDYNYFVLGQPMNLVPGKNIPQPKPGNCKY